MTKKLLHFLVAVLVLAGCDQETHLVGTGPAMEPTLFAPRIVSSQTYDEYGVSFAPDGSEVYFTRSSVGRRSRPSILVSRVVDGEWSEPEPASFSTGWEEAPFITSDGSLLFFSSRRDIPGWGPVRGSSNLWVVERSADGWSPPSPVRGEVNRPGVDGRGAPGRSETGPILLSDGTLLYSTEEAAERGSDIYAADPDGDRFTNPRPLLLNTAGDEASPAMSPDGQYLVFHGFRDVYSTGDDLFVAERTEYGWSEPYALPAPINSAGDEAYPSFSPDGSLLFFSSNRRQQRMSVYYVSVEAAGLAAHQDYEGEESFR